MADRLESSIVRDILKALRTRGAWAEKMHGGSFQTRGLPDVLAVYHGCAYGIEVKRPGKAATPIQQYVLDRMAEAGAVTGVAHSVEEALALLKE